MSSSSLNIAMRGTLDHDLVASGTPPPPSPAPACEARLAPGGTVEIPPWAAVLGSFYESLGLPCPLFAKLNAQDIPEPYRHLLAHSQDMTSTLEQFHRSPVHLHVLGRQCVANHYTREVVLQLEGSRTPVEYGAICIHLRHFPEAVQQTILAERQPFGRILELEGIGYLSWPQAFFAVKADPHMSRLLGLDDEPVLYGRRNVMLDGRRRLLAEVVEILPTITKPPARS